jgi:RNA-directed DNA polymerase
MKPPKTTNKIQLQLLGLPTVDSLEDLSNLTHLSKGLIFQLCQFTDKFYKTYKIDKKSGGKRVIAQPCDEMKALQGWILRNILDRLHVSSAAKGFEKHLSIADNALPHRGSNALLCIDLEDYFPSIKANKIWSIFHTVGYGPRISATLASICCYKGCLPQGAPTSPKLANLVTLSLDRRILGLVGKKGIIYTRYADDLAFSSFSSSKLVDLFPVINAIISSEGFTINSTKTRIAGPGRQHKITGLVVNDRGAGIGRQALKKLRAQILLFGRYAKGGAPIIDLRRMKGWLSFLKGIDKQRYRMIEKYLLNLKKKYPQSSILDLVGEQ